MASTPIKPKGYQVTEEIYHGSRTIVQRALRTSDKKPVVLKLLKNSYPSFGELVQFRNQYTITKNLHIPGIVTPLALEKYGNGYMLVMADEGYQSLPSSLNYPLNLDKFFPIALQLTVILQGLYQNRIIHKDIKPANILIHPCTEIVQLIDFSISSLLPKEMQQVQNPNVLEGTLAYMSPEQTGRMNRGMDYRTDFYSLGVTFYQLLTGRLPFESGDPMELVHCHLAKQPPSLQELIGVDFPEVLSAIVMKLMAKNPEERYQSGLGLRHDLEQCWEQWQAKGKIEKFNLGTKDLCDRFLIPEKLYGREAEVKELLTAFERVSQGVGSWEKTSRCELILVAGFSGIGKTAVVNEVHKPIVKQRGYFIKGKFDQFNRNIPFSALVQALRNLMRQLLSESDAQLQQWQEKIVDAVGGNGQVIIDVIPELEKIIGKQPNVPELSGSAAQHRFNLFFGKFIQVFTTKEHPLVIFLDDLQWADSASLNLLKFLMSEGERGYLLLIGAYRDNEVFSTHPLMLTLDEITKAEGKIHTITLEALSEENINYLVADTLGCNTEIATPLTELVYQKTKGNPFFTTQFLLGLYGEKLIKFNRGVGHWECNIVQVRQRALTDDVVEFMAQRLQKLPEETQEFLKLAACIGNQFDLQTLAIVSEQSKEDTAASLWRALQEELILPQSEVYKFYLADNSQGNGTQINEINPVANYKFLHDRVQQAAYSLIREEEKQATHLQIGRLILDSIPPHELDKFIFDIVNHLNIGGDLILDQKERDRVAKLNFQASQKAKASVAYEASLGYCYAGKKFLNKASWEENYPLSFNLAIATIEAEYFNHNLQTAQQLSQRTLNKAQTLLDRVKVHELQILFEINQNRMNEAINIALDVLSLVGINIPTQSQEIQAEISSLRQETALPIAEIANLANLEEVEDESKLAAMGILTNASSAAYIANSSLYPVIVIHTVRQCMKYGNSSLAASAYCWYGALLCGVYNEIETGYEFGKLSVQLLEKFNARHLAAKVSNMFNVFIRPWKEHLHNSINTLPEAIQSGFDNGDVEYAFYAAVHYCNYLFYSGSPLEEVYQAQKSYIPRIVKAKYDFHEGFLRINQQVVANLLGETEAPQILQGFILDGNNYLSQWLENKIIFLVLCFYEAQTRLAYLFGDNLKAVEAGEQGWQYQQAAMGTFYASEFNFYHSLALLTQKNLTPCQKEKIAANQNQLKMWGKFSPRNFQHKYELVEAELNRIAHQKMAAIELYDCAIQGAKENQYLQEEALANELAAKFYLDWGKDKIAAIYMQEAYYCYARWGAKAKIDDLEKRYPYLLQPIISQEQVNSFVNSSSNYERTLSLTDGSTSNSFTLDLATVIKASQAISSEIHFNQLLCTLMSVAIENSGADKGIFISPQSGKLIVEAVVGFPSQGEIHNSSIACELFEPTEPMPHSLVNYVFRNRETLVIHDLSTDTKFAGDEYFQTHQPQSILCTPIFYQGKITSILYLENNFTKEAFTSDRLALLNLLCNQAAISLENARLYENLEQKVQERTRELSDALAELKATQKQLVESEKMAALGSLVAGVAHEINTPVGTSITVASNLAAKTQTFANSINQGQLKRSVLNNYLETAQQSSDLLVQNLHRAGELVNSFKQVAVDQSNLELRTFKVKEYIEGVLFSIAPQLKTSPHEITVSGDANLTLNSYAGCLAQVVTNLVMNSLKHAYPQEQPGKLHWEILSEEKDLKIIYTDDGCGISPENLGKIFEPFFTTKRNEGGTGLGLHIVYNLITHKLGGSIEVDSRIGEGTRFSLTLPSIIV